MTLAFLASLLAWASYLSGYPGPDRPVTVNFVTREWMVAQPICGGNQNCPVAGLYVGGDQIFVGNWLESEERNAVIVHEFVHWMQMNSGKFGNTCMDRYNAEREAYMVQNNYIWQAQKRLVVVRPPLISCPA